MRSVAYLPDINNTLVGSDIQVDLGSSNNITFTDVTGEGITSSSPYTNYSAVYAASAVSDGVMGALIEGTWSDITTTATITINSDPALGGVLIALNYTDPARQIFTKV